MGQPAACLGDMTVCPAVTPGVPPIPHVGGPITGPGNPTVLIGGRPAVTLGDSRNYRQGISYRDDWKKTSRQNWGYCRSWRQYCRTRMPDCSYRWLKDTYSTRIR